MYVTTKFPLEWMSHAHKHCMNLFVYNHSEIRLLQIWFLKVLHGSVVGSMCNFTQVSSKLILRLSFILILCWYFVHLIPNIPLDSSYIPFKYQGDHLCKRVDYKPCGNTFKHNFVPILKWNRSFYYSNQKQRKFKSYAL